MLALNPKNKYKNKKYMSKEETNESLCNRYDSVKLFKNY